MSRLVAVSNRVSMPKRGSTPGGLAVGLLAAMEARGGVWFGWDGETTEGAPGPATVNWQGNVEYVSTALAETEYRDFYLGFCNSVLWPLFHYFIAEFRYSAAQFEAYQRVNSRFAQELLPHLQATDLIWVHDYHLIPLAQKLREAGARHPMGFFLHIPFPTAEVLRVLPVYGELLQGLLAYDLLGFQTHTDLRAFREGVRHVWPEARIDDATIRVGDRVVVTMVTPIGVDVEGLRAQAEQAVQSEECRRMVTGLLGRRLMVGVDRLDYSKGLVQRFRAYERFLETYPDNRNRVTFLQIAPLSRTDVRAYSEIRRDLEQATGRTNGRFAETDWTPIRYLNRNFPRETLMGFLRSALIGIVTPVRDGMNLVAKEFVAAQDPADPGVLVLSTLAGAAHELDAALLVNPYDTRAMAHAIQQALDMPLGERRDRHKSMLEALERNCIHAWHSRFVDALGEIPRAAAA
ncbi:MAG TPA: trehalose-6-phosphate synthase [Steroidobacteraceae bacterium]|jgi:trehalose 6-phosphate synthase|nr:trehalose-6-phosphate synthase [Steroidobacteraceae bacterium]